MGHNDRLLKLDIDYESDPEEKGIEPNLPGVTSNLINIAFQTNYRDGMDDKTSRVWRNIRKALEDAIDSKAGFVLFSRSDFDNVYKEVYACKFNPMLSRWAPYLYDELDIIKTRTLEDEIKVQEEMQDLFEAAAPKPDPPGPTPAKVTELINAKS